jgi:hypothetical protein
LQEKEPVSNKTINTADATGGGSALLGAVEGAVPTEAESLSAAADGLVSRIGELAIQESRSRSSETRDRRPAFVLSDDVETFLNKVMDEAFQAAKGNEMEAGPPESGMPARESTPAAESSEGMGANRAIPAPASALRPSPGPAGGIEESLEAHQPVERRSPAGVLVEQKSAEASPMLSEPFRTASISVAAEAKRAAHELRRRSERIMQEIAIEVAGTDANGKDFIVACKTIDLSRHGAKILLHRDLVPDQEITVCCPDTGWDSNARVVGLFSKEPAGHTYGIELLLPDVGFWNISFPPVPGRV